MTTDKTTPETTDTRSDPPHDPHLSPARNLAHNYIGPTIKLPIFGHIPLKPTELLSDLRIKDNPPLWAQFFKYGICGIISTLALSLVWILARIYIPEYIAETLPPETKKLHSAHVILVAFIIANLVAYFTNRIFVFTPGKHSFAREILLFFLISAISFTAGNYAKDYFIDQGARIDIAAFSFAVSSALVNFVARKYLVFSN